MEKYYKLLAQSRVHSLVRRTAAAGQPSPTQGSCRQPRGGSTDAGVSFTLNAVLCKTGWMWGAWAGRSSPRSILDAPNLKGASAEGCRQPGQATGHNINLVGLDERAIVTIETGIVPLCTMSALRLRWPSPAGGGVELLYSLRSFLEGAIGAVRLRRADPLREQLCLASACLCPSSSKAHGMRDAAH